MNLAVPRAARKIGVLTFHRCINYGSYWQARCLVEGLRGMGADVVLLDHHSTAVKWAEWRCALSPTLPLPTRRTDIPAYVVKTRKFLEAFAQLPLSEPFPLEAPERMGDYDAIVVGSDEVWNLRHPWFGGRGIFYGAGLRSPRLVSYAASFGNQKVSDGLCDHWRRHLRDFRAISVRDDNSRRIIRRALDKEPELVLDPCLQFPPGASAGGQGEKRAAYIALYGHGFPGWFGRAIRHWANRNGRAIVSIGYRNDWADEQRLSAGPEEFAHLIARSDAVVTNFFHGCVFSLINGLPFAAVPSDYRRNKLRDLMAALNMPERIAAPGTSPGRYARLLAEPPGPATAIRIAQLRGRSDAFLRRALDLEG